MIDSFPFPTLEVNLTAITDNYLLLASRNSCAAVVKANAYGLGVGPVATALYQKGCREFFVATLEEAIELRGVLSDAQIYVFHGCRTGQVNTFLHYALIPVINDIIQYTAWNHAGNYALHIDTGMCRLGLTCDEAYSITPHPNLCLILSHLACADEPAHPKNATQLALFEAVSQHFKGIRCSFANSAGIFLDKAYYFDLLRPGCALYGISPAAHLTGMLKNVVQLSAPVLQYRYLKKAETVGYGASITLCAGTVLATVEYGYADGLFRQLSGHLTAYAGGIKLNVVGRISMDMVSVDVTSVPEALRNAQLRIYFIDNNQPVDTIAKLAGTIGYEVFTRLGARLKKQYKTHFIPEN